MLIRMATLDDLDLIAAVEAECFPPAEAATKEKFAKRLQLYGDHFWLMFDGIRLVAFIDGLVTNWLNLSDAMYEKAGMHDENGSWQMIFGVNTIPEYREKGCAGKILEKVIADAKQQGRQGLVLTCKAELVNYYSKFDFINEGGSASVHGNAVWYQMRLTFSPIFARRRRCDHIGGN